MEKTHSYQLNPEITSSIFRRYDIRGIVEKHLTEDNVYSIGRAIAEKVKAADGNNVIVGRDGRNSGPSLLKAMSAGLMDGGCNVISIGMVTTPMLYYATHVMETKHGVMVTGSHNPAEYNGIKTVINGTSIYGDEVKELHTMIVQGDLTPTTPGQYSETSITEEYLKRIISDIKPKRKLKVVIDCGNGAGGITAPRIFEALNCEVTSLFCEVDGNFPNHHPDPSIVSNLKDLIEEVKKQNADVGFAFDGDADRIGIVTDKGEIILPDRILMYLALDLLTRYKGEYIPYDIKCTRNLATFINEHGGNPVMVPSGHSLLKKAMAKHSSLLAGELSGHIFMRERWFGFDDGVYVAARMLELLSQDQRKTSEIFATIPDSINTPEMKIPMPDDKKAEFMEQLADEVNKIENAEIITTDGLRVEFNDGFGLVRKSNTTPNLTLRFEGNDEASLQRIKDLFKEILLKMDSGLELPF